MSHPDPEGSPDLTPIRFGEVWENPVTGERATILELPFSNPERCATAELTAPFGTRLPGSTVIPRSSSAHRARGRADREARRADEHPAPGRDRRRGGDHPRGERFGHMIETMFGLARLGHTDVKGMPHPLQLAPTAREFSDVIQFRRPPAAVQRVLFGALAPIARRCGYRATYPQLSRTILAPRWRRRRTGAQLGAEAASWSPCQRHRPGPMIPRRPMTRANPATSRPITAPTSAASPLRPTRRPRGSTRPVPKVQRSFGSLLLELAETKHA
jgi:hypothetical protein